MRAITKPGPYARAMLNGCEVKVKKAKKYRVRLIMLVHQVKLGVQDGITVKTGNSVIFRETLNYYLNLRIDLVNNDLLKI